LITVVAVAPNAGLSTAEPGTLPRPVAMTGPYGARKVNVRAQQRDPTSLFRWFQNLSQTLRSAPEIGTGRASAIDVPCPPSVLAHRFDAPSGSLLLLHNLAPEDVSVDIGQAAGDEAPDDLPGRRPYGVPTPRLVGLALHGYGYRWIRLSRSDLPDRGVGTASLEGERRGQLLPDRFSPRPEPAEAVGGTLPQVHALRQPNQCDGRWAMRMRRPVTIRGLIRT
jgi:hypothetical protein